jgi:molybdopterin/thiamine biosynthesis adenylyltransferase
MKHKKWIKMPNGKLVRRRPDKLSLFLTGNEHLLSMGTGSAYSLESIEQTPAQHRRDNTRSYDNRNFAGCEVTMIGAGSVGSHLASAIGSPGLSMNIIDYKKVKFKHTLGKRTIYDSSLIGEKKVYALKKIIERDSPGAKVNPFPYNVGEIPDNELKHMFARSLAVILAIDDPVQIVRISDIAYSIGVELIQVAMHAGGLSGHIAVCVPFVTPCLRCTLEISGSQDIHRLDSEPANSIDIVTVVQHTARLVTDIMYSKITGQRITRWNTSKNLIYIANTKQEISPDGPGIFFERCEKRPGCPICSTH